MAGVVTAELVAGCAARGKDLTTALEKRVENRADFPVTVQALRSVGVDFERSVNGNLSGRFLVSHAVLGTGPVRFHVLIGLGRFRQGYRTREKLRVPEEGLAVITLQASLPASTIVVYNRRPGADRPAPRPNN